MTKNKTAIPSLNINDSPLKVEDTEPFTPAILPAPKTQDGYRGSPLRPKSLGLAIEPHERSHNGSSRLQLPDWKPIPDRWGSPPPRNQSLDSTVNVPPNSVHLEEQEIPVVVENATSSRISLSPTGETLVEFILGTNRNIVTTEDVGISRISSPRLEIMENPAPEQNIRALGLSTSSIFQDKLSTPDLLSWVGETDHGKECPWPPEPNGYPGDHDRLDLLHNFEDNAKEQPRLVKHVVSNTNPENSLNKTVHTAQSTFSGGSYTDPQRSTVQSSTSARAPSTMPTAISHSQSSQSHFDKSNGGLQSIPEESKILPNSSEPTMVYVEDSASTISADSILLSAEQELLVTQRFSNALLKDLPSNCLQPHCPQIYSSEFRSRFKSLLKGYSRKVIEDAPRSSKRRKASKAVRKLIDDIISQYQKTARRASETVKDTRVSNSITRQTDHIDLKEKTIQEKFRDWNLDDMVVPTHQHDQRTASHSMNIGMMSSKDAAHDQESDLLNEQLSEVSSNTSYQPQSDTSDMSLSIDNEPPFSDQEDQDAYEYLVNHEAFSNLLDSLRVLVEQRLCDQMELIRHRILLALRRPDIVGNAQGGVFHATFNTEWDAVAFLRDQYTSGLSKSLRYVLAVTGSSIDAQLTTVEHYLHENWLENHDFLVDMISGIPEQTSSTTSAPVLVSPDRRTVSVSGSESLIVAVGQQLAWLGASCSDSNGQLANSYTSFLEAESMGEESNGPLFDITYDRSELTMQESGSCWHELVGNAVIAVGFPIPHRPTETKGLDLSLELMGALANIPLATGFCGGYVLKGRSIVFVPVERKGNAVQWHMIKKDGGGRLNLRELRSLCTTRLTFQELNENDLATTNCFLGWYPRTTNHLATATYDHLSVKYSSTLPVSKRYISLTGFTVGFSKLGQGALNFAFGKKDGIFHNETREYYEDLLDDAAQIHVVLQDMKDRRAWWTSSEAIILQIIIHRHAQKSFKVDEKPVGLATAVPYDPLSVRQAMLDNADIDVKRDLHLTEAQVNTQKFKDLVKELYTQFEGIQANQEEFARESGWELRGDSMTHLYGWEYMDFVNRKHLLKLRGTQLRKTCGGWPKLIREVNTIALFGVDFGSIIEPIKDAQICESRSTLPCQKDYLAVETTTLKRLYQESGASDYEDSVHITVYGTYIHPSRHVFKPYNCRLCRTSKRDRDICIQDRIQQIVFKNHSKGTRKLPLSSMHGAIIIGQGPGTWIDKSLSITLLSKRSIKNKESASSVRQPPEHAVGTLLPPDYHDIAPPRLFTSSSSEDRTHSGTSIISASSSGATSISSNEYIQKESSVPLPLNHPKKAEFSTPRLATQSDITSGLYSKRPLQSSHCVHASPTPHTNVASSYDSLHEKPHNRPQWSNLSALSAPLGPSSASRCAIVNRPLPPRIDQSIGFGEFVHSHGSTVTVTRTSDRTTLQQPQGNYQTGQQQQYLRRKPNFLRVPETLK